MKKYIQHECLNSLRRFPRWLGTLPSSRPRGVLARSSPLPLLGKPRVPPADPVLPSGSPTCLDQKQVDKRSEAPRTEGPGRGFPFSLHFGWRSPALVQTISMISPLRARPFVPLGVSLPGHNPAKFPLNTQRSVCCWTCSCLSFRPGIFWFQNPASRLGKRVSAWKTLSSTASSLRGPSSSSPA